ncbi:MAG: hypothetical protein JO303_12470, partial [Caulobacteraceae bacterium]|nr:hypothetical protein [Caulobacteraceae bacterium]
MTIIPIGLLAAGGLELSRFYAARGAAQNALDAAALAAGASQSTSQTALLATANKVFNQDIANSSAVGAQIQNLTYNSTLHQITATATGSFTPLFGAFDPISTLTYNVQTQTLMQTSGTLEIALVLDNTYSMSQTLGASTRLGTLKTAALGLVSTVMTTANQGSVKIGVVPYGDYVNVGASNLGASWLSGGTAYSTVTPKTCSQTTGQTCNTVTSTVAPYQSCTGGVTTNYDGVISTTPKVCQTLTTKTTTTCSGGTTTSYSCPVTTNYQWFGCVLPQWSGSGLAMPVPATPYTALMQITGECNTPITPLTTSSTTVNAAINAMTDYPSNYHPDTYIPAGLLWGINIIAPGGPLSQGAAYDPKNKMPRKVIVLMTDGSNMDFINGSGLSTYPWLSTGATGTGFHCCAHDSNYTTSNVYAGSAAQLAALLPAYANNPYNDEQALCNYAKAHNIEIYTVGVGDV